VYSLPKNDLEELRPNPVCLSNNSTKTWTFWESLQLCKKKMPNVCGNEMEIEWKEEHVEHLL